MALFKFTENILNDRPIEVYNHGKHIRDFTYVDDIVDGITSLINRIPNGKKNWSSKNLNQSEVDIILSPEENAILQSLDRDQMP